LQITEREGFEEKAVIAYLDRENRVEKYAGLQRSRAKNREKKKLAEQEKDSSPAEGKNCLL